MKKRVAALGALALATACSQHIEFASNPAGAHLWINGQDMGVTPARGDFSYTAFSTYEVILAKDGYETYRGNLGLDVKAAHLVFGIICCWPALLFMQGPLGQYQFQLTPVGGAWVPPPTNQPQAAPTWQPAPEPTSAWHPQPESPATARPSQQTPTPLPGATPTPADPWDFGDPK